MTARKWFAPDKQRCRLKWCLCGRTAYMVQYQAHPDGTPIFSNRSVEHLIRSITGIGMCMHCGCDYKMQEAIESMNRTLSWIREARELTFNPVRSPLLGLLNGVK